MKKKTTEIATNTSSGAEKVQEIEKEIKTGAKGEAEKMQRVKTVKRNIDERPSAPQKNTAKAEAALGNGDKKVNTPPQGLAEKEAAVAKARVEVALTKKELQEKRKQERAKKVAEKKAKAEKRLAEKKAKLQKRLAEKKIMAEKRLAERKARIEKRKAEREAMIRERAHEKANKHQAEHKKKVAVAEKKTERTNNRRKKEKKSSNERNKGYGGWLAAVVTLGSVTLALTTALTVGAVEMNKTKKGLMSAYRGTMYEMTGIMEHVDDDLERARISASSVQQSRILTDLLVQARLAEADLERLPITAEQDVNVTSFLNRTAAECERMLQKLRYGDPLNEEDFRILEGLYDTNHSIRSELDALMGGMTDKDLTQYLKDGMGNIGDALKRMEEMTVEKGREIFDKAKEKMQEGKEKLQEGKEKILDEKSEKAEKSERSGAFSGEADKQKGKEADTGMENNGGEGKEGSERKIDPTEAERMCQRYFSDYNITDFQCVGETNSRMIKAYNVQGYDEKGTLLFAEVSQMDGALIKFDYYEDCSEDTFDIRNAERIAEQFLEKLGYDDMEVVRYKENGTMTDFTFVYEDDGVAYYPDEVRVKICRSRGVVTGFDASKYLKNHKERKEFTPSLTLGEAQARLHKKLTVESSRLAVVKAGKRERAAYEFLCSYDKELYFVYVDANTGEELSIVNARTV